jgi:acetylornithine deacetylase/succinyl-diaminopimelate desuccinylase-like protein
MERAKIEEIYRHIDRSFEAYLEELRRYLRQPSISATGEGIEQTAKMTADYLRALGSNDVRLIRTAESNPLVYGTLNSKDARRTLVLYNMYDVQPPDPIDQWVSPPFGAEIIDDKVIARGAVNTKGPLMGMLKGLEAYLDVQGRLPINLIFMIEGEEELGSPHIPEFVKILESDLKKAEAVYMHGNDQEEDGTPAVHLGVKGLVYFELETDIGSRDVHGSLATVLPNPVWELVWALNTMKDRNNQVLIEGFYDDVRPPTNDEMEMIKEIAKRKNMESFRKFLGVREFRRDLKGLDFYVENYFKPTLNIDGIISGYTGTGTKTLVPSKARAKMDIRLVPNMTSDKMIELVRTHLRKNGYGHVTVTPRSRYEWARSSVKSHIAQSVITSLRQMGYDPLIYPTLEGSAPFYIFSKPPLNLPFVLAGFSFGFLAHAPNEYITLSQFRESMRLMATIIGNLS